MQRTDLFSSRWGLLLASLGMAIGAGNIWRFPRVVSQHGGGAFMLAWLVALFAWSIPLLIIELYWGRRSRRGPVGAFATVAGPGWSWAGGFVALCCSGIMFYYAVVAGWCLYYLGSAAAGGLDPGTVAQRWDGFVGSGWPAAFLGLAIGLCTAVVALGVRQGIERVSRILIPLLFLLLFASALRALTLPGAERGLERMFRPNFHLLLEHRVWLEAFSQSAWSTGAGWGLLLVYGGYTRKRGDVVLDAAITGLGNNAASLLAGFAVLPTVFALLPPEQAEQVSSAGNEGLAFIWMPRLFLSGEMPGGPLLLVVFFAALAVAALSSLVAMVELGIRTLMDFGIKRRTAVLVVAVAGFLLGLPSALSLSFFKNQDWVWGLGLLISGALFALGTAAHGVRRLRETISSESPGIRLGGWFDWLVVGFIPAAFVIMLLWWLFQSVEWEPGWYDPLATFSLGTCLLQWAMALGGLGLLNKWMSRRVLSAGKEPGP